MRTIHFHTSHVLDAWSENVRKNDKEFKIDYIKLINGVLITVTEEGIFVYDSDDLEVTGSSVLFKDIITRK